MTQAPPAAAARFAELWKILSEPLLPGAEHPLRRRLTDAAAVWSGARRAILFLREKDAWSRAATAGLDGEEIRLPDPYPPEPRLEQGVLWIPLEAEGEIQGHLGLEGVAAEESHEVAACLGFLLGALLGAHRMSRLV